MDRPQLQPLRATQVLEFAIKTVARSAGAFLGAAAAIAIPAYIGLAQVVDLVLPDDLAADLRRMLTQRGSEPVLFDPADATAVYTAIGMIAVVTLIAYALIATACTHMAIERYRRAPVSARPALDIAIRRLPSMLWLVVLLGATVFTAAVTGGAIGQATGSGFGILVTFAALSAVFTFWSVALPALLIEDTRGTKALVRSTRLVQGRFWPTLGLLMMTLLVTGLVQLIVGSVLSLGGAALANAGIVEGAIAVFTWPLQAAVVGVLYLDLRLRKEEWNAEPEVIEKVPGRPELPTRKRPRA